MTSKKVLVILALLVALIVAAYLKANSKSFLTKNSDAEALNSATEGAGQMATFFEAHPQSLTSAATKIDCRKPGAARLSVGQGLSHFWQDAEDDEIQTFIHFEPASRILSVCHKGRAVAAILPADPEIKDNESVRVSEAQFEDLNGDGKNELFVYQGQCKDGACLGDYLLLQIDGENIKKLYDLHAETVEVAKENGRNGLRFERYCYTKDLGMGPAFFSVAEFTKEGALNVVPYQELREKFPEAVAQMKPSQDLGLGDDSPVQQKAYLKIHDLIVQAYQGKSSEALLNELGQITATLPPIDGETSPAARLNLSCDPGKILELISGR